MRLTTFLPYLSNNFPQKGELTPIPTNTTWGTQKKKKKILRDKHFKNKPWNKTFLKRLKRTLPMLWEPPYSWAASTHSAAGGPRYWGSSFPWHLLPAPREAERYVRRESGNGSEDISARFTILTHAIPVTKDIFHWNFPKPKCSSASSTVKVSVKGTRQAQKFTVKKCVYNRYRRTKRSMNSLSLLC